MYVKLSKVYAHHVWTMAYETGHTIDGVTEVELVQDVFFNTEDEVKSWYKTLGYKKNYFLKLHVVKVQGLHELTLEV